MPVYKIGNTDIEYELERKRDIGRRYIEITPARILVTVNEQDSEQDVHGFLERKERWLFDNTQNIKKRVAEGHSVHRFITGVKIPYRGRRMKLTITRKTTPDVGVEFRHGFVVSLPDYVTGVSQDEIVENALKFWLKKRMKRDVHEIVGRYARKYDLCPKAIRVKEQKHIWGSCSKDGTINLNWHLIYAPKPVLEYAVLHELCHLQHRTHCEKFWKLVKNCMPDYETRKAWLDQNEHLMAITIAENQ